MSGIEQSQVMSVVADLASTLSALANDPKEMKKQIADLKKAAKENVAALKELQGLKEEVENKRGGADAVMAAAERKMLEADALVVATEQRVEDMQEKARAEHEAAMVHVGRLRSSAAADREDAKCLKQEYELKLLELQEMTRNADKRDSELDTRESSIASRESDLIAKEADLKARIEKMSSLAAG